MWESFSAHFPASDLSLFVGSRENHRQALWRRKFIPNVYVIDQSGVISWQRVGNMDLAGSDLIIQEVEKLLANGSGKSSGSM